MLRKYKAITPSLRHKISILKPKRWSLKLLKREGLINQRVHQTGGRNNTGRITIRHIGGGHKRRYRSVDLARLKGQYSTNLVERIDYDPNRSGYLALLSCGKKRWYILASEGLKVGDKITGYKKENVSFSEGHSMPLKYMPLGTIIHNIDGKLIRSAGTKGSLFNVSSNKALVILPSGNLKEIDADKCATIGAVSNSLHRHKILGKAGASRWLGIRPTVRGEAMNPIDHPHGGKSHGSGGLGNPAKTKWGKLAKWR